MEYYGTIWNTRISLLYGLLPANVLVETINSVCLFKCLPALYAFLFLFNFLSVCLSFLSVILVFLYLSKNFFKNVQLRYLIVVI